MMKEQPILFKSEMVRAILDGRKTQTRRVIKPQPEKYHEHLECKQDDEGFYFVDILEPYESKCPYGRPGDLLWVREMWRIDVVEMPPIDVYGNPICKEVICYRADDDEDYLKWRPSIFMPKEYARLWLRITDVRVERVQEISREDAAAEGHSFIRMKGHSFHRLWDQINAKRGYSWESNPFVWVIKFDILSNERDILS